MATHGLKRSEMKDKVARPLGRRVSDQVDSGSESHPLLSSGTSQTSQASFGTVPCMFPDSETSDFESAPRRELPPMRDRQTHFNNLRRPYASQVSGASPRKPGRGSWDDQMSTVTFNRFQNYSKLRTYSYDPARPRLGGDLEVPPSVFVPYIPGGPDQDGGKQNSIVTIFAIWNTIMGSSLLTMPWGVERAGLPTAVALMVLMGALCLYTTYRILQVQDRHGDPTDGEVADLSRMLLGRSAEMVAKFFSLVVLLGANIVYWILMSNFLYHSVDFLYDVVTGSPAGPFLPDGSLPPAVVCAREMGVPNATMSSLLANQSSVTSLLANQSSVTSLLAIRAQDDAFHHAWDMHTTVPIFLVLIIAPLVNFKSATFFTKFNSLGTLSVAYLLVFVCIKASRWGINLDFSDVDSPSYARGFLPSFPALSGMLALSFFIHNIIITIMRNNRVQENNGRDLSVAYVLVTLTYITIGTVFYVTFPLRKSCIEDNLLNNFENWDVLTVVARIFLFFQLVTVYPLIAYMLRVQIHGRVERHGLRVHAAVSAAPGFVAAAREAHRPLLSRPRSGGARRVRQPGGPVLRPGPLTSSAESGPSLGQACAELVPSLGQACAEPQGRRKGGGWGGNSPSTHWLDPPTGGVKPTVGITISMAFQTEYWAIIW